MSIAETDVQRRLEGVRRDARDGEVKRPRPLPWLGKRLLLLVLVSGSAGFAFHFFGTWPLGVIAIITPIVGWIALILDMQRQFGASDRSPNVLSEKTAAAQAMMQTEGDLAAQMDWWRRFGT